MSSKSLSVRCGTEKHMYWLDLVSESQFSGGWNQGQAILPLFPPYPRADQHLSAETMIASLIFGNSLNLSNPWFWNISVCSSSISSRPSGLSCHRPTFSDCKRHQNVGVTVISWWVGWGVVQGIIRRFPWGSKNTFSTISDSCGSCCCLLRDVSSCITTTPTVHLWDQQRNLNEDWN